MATRRTATEWRTRAGAAADLAELDALRRDLAGRGTTDAQRRYATAVYELLTARALAYEEVLQRVADATGSAVTRLAAIRAPRRAAAAHNKLLAAFTANAEAQRELYVAIRGGDPAHARAAAEAAVATHAALRDASDAVVGALGDDVG